MEYIEAVSIEARDLYSFKKEYAAGHKVNSLVYILTEHNGVEIQDACSEAGFRYGELMDEFLANKALLPSWDAEIDGTVAAAVKCMEDWVVGSLHWSFETPRYFGDSKDEVKRTRLVQISE
ncbi:hypothetical protein CERSUDRAFT_98482 [Gelatoporia subvermispora B]|uniref:Uncharacterized protein n=1 Tax=Ceriporiopsis subvermispora (strain B) TaxID=914234 RepID=M2R384_CERS8|nr:hypothetical protein CERSUDRAFT_98482 [Gelatoporia subvermispora B]